MAKPTLSFGHVTGHHGHDTPDVLSSESAEVLDASAFDAVAAVAFQHLFYDVQKGDVFRPEHELVVLRPDLFIPKPKKEAV